MSGPLPARLDREALERVIRRAAELQAGEVPDGLTTDEVVALGREVGIPPQHLHQALLEERARAGSAEAGGALDRLAGPGVLQAQRVVQGDTEAIADTLAAHLESEELFCVQRRQPSRVLFEPLGGLDALMQRSGAAFRRKRPFLLSNASSVVAAFTQLEPGFVHVLLSADLKRYRGGFVGGAAAAGSVGVAATTVLLALGAFVPLALAPLPFGVALGWGVVRQYPPKLQRVQLGLERVLDHLEARGGTPRRQLPPRQPGIFNLLVDEVRRSLHRPEP